MREQQERRTEKRRDNEEENRRGLARVNEGEKQRAGERER